MPMSKFNLKAARGLASVLTRRKPKAAPLKSAKLRICGPTPVFHCLECPDCVGPLVPSKRSPKVPH